MLHYDIKYQCLNCFKILNKRESDKLNEKLLDQYPVPHRDYLWEGYINLDKLAVFHGKTEDYFTHGCPGRDEVECGLMVPLDINNTAINCLVCRKEYGTHETKDGYLCRKCIRNYKE